MAGTPPPAAPAPLHALDLGVFEYADAPWYIFTFAASLIAVCICLDGVFAGVTFVLSYPPLHGWAISYLITLAVAAASRALLACALRRCCVNGSRMHAPRAFMAYDAFNLFISLFISVTVGFTRVLVLLVTALLHATQLSGSPLGLFDAGFAQYGAMHKTNLAWVLDSEAAPQPGMLADE
jgi:hypothetical protein